METLTIANFKLNTFKPSLFAESSSYNYNEGVYNSDIYNGSIQSANKSLINSGTIAGLSAIVGGLIIFTAIFIKYWKRPNKKAKKS